MESSQAPTLGLHSKSYLGRPGELIASCSPLSLSTMLKLGAVGSLVLDTRWADSPECQVQFLKEPFSIACS
jgi:hypothetical protein